MLYELKTNIIMQNEVMCSISTKNLQLSSSRFLFHCYFAKQPQQHIDELWDECSKMAHAFT